MGCVTGEWEWGWGRVVMSEGGLKKGHFRVKLRWARDRDFWERCENWCFSKLATALTWGIIVGSRVLEENSDFRVVDVDFSSKIGKSPYPRICPVLYMGVFYNY